MKEIELFQQFGIGGKDILAADNNRCVIYTRVSTKEQAETNCSLETQKKACEDYARRNGFEIVEYFGGTYESAKTLNRKEFQKMLTFLRRRKGKIGHLVVYAPDRFARETAGGLQIINELKRFGMKLHTVLQQVNGDTAIGHLFRIFQMAMSEFDNINRRDKCMAGTLTRLEKGGYCGPAPFGYENITRNGQKIIVPDDNAKYVAAAFEMKGYDRLTNTEIVKNLEAMGCKRLYRQRLPEIFENPVYCGMIRHKALEGRVVKGQHDGLVSRDLFLMVNQLQQESPRGWKHEPENENIPLKKFICCDKCGKPLTGYLVKSRGIHYYKCNTNGCKVNVNAKKVNEGFREVLSHLVLDESWRDIAKRSLVEHIDIAEKEKEGRIKLLRKNRLQIAKKLERLEERFIEEELTKDLFLKYQGKYRKQIGQIEQEEIRAKQNLSNKAELVNFATEICANIAKLWDSGVYQLRQRVQEIVFPEGLAYDKENHIYRTNRINSIIALFSQISQKTDPKNSKQQGDFALLSASVARPGIEPGS